ncbi:fumarate hydratase class II [Actinomycetota bacterium]|nr:fumarate hydratase class II [Actinomycetota bacterium]
MPLEVVKAIAYIKLVVAKSILKSDVQENRPDKELIENTIVEVAQKIIDGELDNQFGLNVFQTGSGTQTNMNVNEVITNLGNSLIQKWHPNTFSSPDFEPIHPNDDVNFAQSSNCVFPSAMHISTVKMLRSKLLLALDGLIKSFEQFASKPQAQTIKLGRTHTQDAVPMRIVDEVQAWVEIICSAKNHLEGLIPELTKLALFGTAVGTGINVPDTPSFKAAAAQLLEVDGFELDSHKFFQISHRSSIVAYSSALKELAIGLLKIGNDIRMYSSGPRGGISELKIPANEPGSSIMPGKVNPTQIESLTQVCAQVLGNDSTISFCASQGQFQLNTYMPVMIYNTLQSTQILADTINNFTRFLVDGLEVNVYQTTLNVQNSLMLVTNLSSSIGYDNASKIAKHALDNNLSIFDASRQMRSELDIGLDDAAIRAILDPKSML